MATDPTKRNFRASDTLYDETTRLATELARHRCTTMTTSAYIREALVEKNERVRQMIGETR